MKLKQMQSIAKKLNLDADNSFWKATEIDLEQAYNGAGPDWMNPKFRHIFTWILRTFLIAVLIHDWDFSFSNGDIEKFKKVNLRFLKNCYKLARDKYKWFLYPIRLIAYSKARLAYIAVKEHGFQAWLEGKEHRKK